MSRRNKIRISEENKISTYRKAFGWHIRFQLQFLIVAAMAAFLSLSNISLSLRFEAGFYVLFLGFIFYFALNISKCLNFILLSPVQFLTLDDSYLRKLECKINIRLDKEDVFNFILCMLIAIFHTVDSFSVERIAATVFLFISVYLTFLYMLKSGESREKESNQLTKGE